MSLVLFAFQSAVTCLIWPPEQQNIIFGLADGKVGISRISSLDVSCVVMYSLLELTFNQSFKPCPSQVRIANLKTNKSTTLYGTDNYVVSLAAKYV